LSKDAEEDLRALDTGIRKRIKERLRRLGAEPRGGPGATQLVGKEGFRVKIGRWRARYIVRDDIREVRVTRIVKRDEATYR
jgi:mRNA-degrading endonuclease RelE of RelBE toxin-antitoxin system